MRKVLRNNAEVAHYWANQIQDQGRAGSMFFEKDIIYSYGYHFPMARIYNTDRGPVVLMTTRDYSTTTAGHKSQTRTAASHLTLFEVPSTGAGSASDQPDHITNIYYFIDQIRENRDAARRARGRGRWLIENADRYADRLEQYITIFDVKTRGKIAKEYKKDFKDFWNGDIFTSQERQEIREKSQRWEADREKRDAAKRARWEAEQKRQAEQAAADLQRWADGENITRWFNNLPVKLRIKADRIETSHGASVTIPAALDFLAYWDAGNNISDYEIDGYNVREYKDGILYIGCHKIPAAEVEKIRAELSRAGANINE